MADPYIDQFETVAYGRFTLSQIPALVKGMDPAFDPVLDHVSGLLKKTTDKMAGLLQLKSGQEPVTYAAAAAGGEDPLAGARDSFDRLLSYVESRKGGKAVATALLQNQQRSTILRQRPAKLVGTLNHALGVIAQHQDVLPEHAAWTKELTDAVAAVEALNRDVRTSRAEQRQMTPEVAAGREEWLKVYGAAKLQVEVVLRLHGRLALMAEIFDDLAETHRVAGVSDGEEGDAGKSGSEQPKGA